MPAFPELPGVVPPEDIERERGHPPRIPAGGPMVEALAARLGSVADPFKLAIAALAPLRPHVARDTWEALLEELPFALRGQVAGAEAHVGAVPAIPDADGLAAFVGLHAQQPGARGLGYVRAVWGALRSVLPPGLDDAVARELPLPLAELWTAAR